MALLRPKSRDDFEIAIICALPIERNAVEAFLDEEYEADGFSYGKAAGDSNAYTTGRLGNQHVVLAYMSGMGMISAAAVASSIRCSFERIRVGLVVGVCGGAPKTADGIDVFLGDVIISTSVVQIDFGRQYPDKFIRKNGMEDTLSRANPEIRAFIGKISGNLVRQKLIENTSIFFSQICAKDGFRDSAYPGLEKDKLYPSNYRHKHQKQDLCATCSLSQSEGGKGDEACELALKASCRELGCDDTLLVKRSRPRTTSIHFGRIACSSQVLKSGKHRDSIIADEGVIAFEMEGAGTWEYIPTIVIKSVCDYADSHKSKEWQEHAALTAAACTKAVLDEWRAVDRPLSETPPPFVPFARDPDFVDCGTLLDQIEEKCVALVPRIALVGLGGVGKSQLAIECSYRIKGTRAFWVHASNAARFEQSYREIADHVKIPGRNNPKANIFKLVYDWANDERQGKCLFILDNVDDARFLLEAQSTGWEGEKSCANSQPLRTYLPQGPVLITTRNRGEALKLVEERDIIAVDPMGEVHALALFKKKLGEWSDDKDLTELARLLEFMPLATVQAAAYISQRAPRFSVRQYIERFQKGEKGKVTLLNHIGGHLRRDWEAQNSILTTWQISFDHILQIRPSAANLLSLMCFFDRQGIPEFVLRNQTETKSSCGRREGSNDNNDGENGDSDSDNDDDYNSSSGSESDDSDEFEENVLTLRNYSFIFINVDKATFEMHRLVQLAMRKWLEAHGKLERWKQQYIKNLCKEFPEGNFENWEKCQILFPHAKSAVAQQPDGEVLLREWALLLYKAAWYAWTRGNAADTEKMSIKSMKARKKTLGQEHQDTLRSMGMVALAFHLRGQWTKAEELEIQVMETSSRVLGRDHPETLTSMANLASTYGKQGRFKEAVELEVQVMEMGKRVLGAEHQDTLISMSNLASTYAKLHRLKEAEDLQVQVIETRKKVLGVEHPDTLTCMNNLAWTFWSQSQWEKAEDQYMQVVKISSKILGAEHPRTLSSMANLAWTHRQQGRNAEALKLMIECTRLRTQVLGPDHPSTTYSIALSIRWKDETDN